VTAKYMPAIMKSPWAKLITRMVPKINDSPAHSSPNSAPVSSPAASDCDEFDFGAHGGGHA